MDKSVLTLNELTLAGLWAHYRPVAPVAGEEVESLAPLVDDAYEQAAGLKGEVQAEVRPMLEALIPSVEYRREVARKLVETRRIAKVAPIDFSLWENVIVYAMTDIRPTAYAVKLKRRRRDLVRKETPVLAKLVPAALNVREVA